MRQKPSRCEVRITNLRYERLVSFDSVHQAIRAEQLLEAAGVDIQIVPTPREIDLSCGQSMLFHVQDQPEVLSLLTRNQVRWAKMFSRSGGGRVYEKLTNFEE